MVGGSPLPLAVSMGEPAGIGTEVLLKCYQALRKPAAGGRIPFFLIDDPARVARITREAHLDFHVASIERPADTAEAFAEALPVLPLSGIDPAPLMAVEAGKPSPATADAVTGSIRRAVELALAGEAGGVVTLPIQKSALQDANFPYPGHTEYLGALTKGAPWPEGEPRGPVMMLAAGDFRTVPVTVHVPLRSVAEQLGTDTIIRIARVTANSLRHDFGVAHPRIAVAGLNPHAGEDGHLGTEDRDVIGPAIAALRDAGIDAHGPHPADTMFHEEARQHYDAALAMYHDQALIPIKTVAFHQAVNVTIGLPIVRTSPDHGTGLAIAGKGVARPDSTLNAILMASRMAESRRRVLA
ncbi:4-hydroxythreonine-4-phosphate dehydrogenase PdxA [Parvularcula lutaonensis]|uniref:4-hydroxythreonine-4-phosphate dehydrogenase n=1 Tax=Parvularcula lutaonensis TaxID=491923 RepID=A0ABV7ME40_9PROT|nr:4-hydroxythreonine-4-phosphate dehydrogenase PdxA [Parvularcula lutaonensis]GGY54548.1 4-hydroxythreonine-4-phosphate dehydrogenase [Parvularcula lutaonensis]